MEDSGELLSEEVSIELSLEVGDTRLARAEVDVVTSVEVDGLSSFLRAVETYTISNMRLHSTEWKNIKLAFMHPFSLTFIAS